MSYMDQFRVEMFAESQPCSGTIALYFKSPGIDGGRPGWAKHLELEHVEEFTTPEPAMRIDYASAQRMMDQLWLVGLRPSEGTGSAGALSATEKHLADMRTIAFKALEIREIRA